MPLFKKASAPLLTAFLLATTLPISCTPEATGNLPAPNSSNSTTQTKETADNTAAISGVVSRGRSQEGLLVPPETPVSVTVSQDGKEVAKTRTDNRGRFYISDLTADTNGTLYQIQIAEVGFDQEERLFAGQVKDLSNIEVKASVTDTQQLTSVSGTLLLPDKTPLANVTVRDKEFTFRETKTSAEGQFALEVAGDQIEVLVNESTPPISVSVQEVEKKGLLTIDITNIRSVRGVIKDKTNSNLAIANALVKVNGRSTSSVTDENGNFELNGVPLGPLALEISVDNNAYSKQTVQVPPATFVANANGQNVAEDVVKNVLLTPIGNLQITFTSESAAGGDCREGYNCIRYDIRPPFSDTGTDGELLSDQSEPYYDNSLAVLNELTAVINVEGTDITRTVSYPAAPFITLKGTDRFGELVTIDEAARAANQIVSILLEDIPGGRQNITISMTGHQTQKSISVFVPPKDTISTELITLYNVQPVNSIGDVKGIIKGIDPSLPGTVRIAFLDVNEDLGISPSSGQTINNNLFPRIRTGLNNVNSYTEVNKDTGEYYLKNVPTGSRIMLAAAAINEAGDISGCYIPSTSVLLNVRSGQVNLAPDLTLVKRPPSECTQ